MEDEPLYRRIKKELIREIEQSSEGENRLEPEERLAKRYGTSRATVREALAELIQQGYLTSWQGRGNFAHPNAMDLKMRIDNTTSFFELLRGAYEHVGVTQSGIKLATASTNVVERYPFWSGENVFTFNWIYSAEGNPMIVCKVEVLKRRMRYVLSRRKDETRLTDYLRRFYQGDITYATAWFKARRSDEIAEIFSIPPEEPLLVWEESFYDLQDRQICYIQVFFHPEKTAPSMLLRTMEL